MFKTEEHKNRRKGEGLQFNTRNLRSAFLWNGELPLAEQARFKLQYEVQFSNLHHGSLVLMFLCL